MFLLLLWRAFSFLFFFFSRQHAGTLWRGCMWYGLGFETTEKLWMEVIIIEIHLGVLTSTLYPRLGSDQRPFKVCATIWQRD